MGIRRAAGYAAVFIAGFLLAMLVQYLAADRRRPEPVAAGIPSVFPTQHQTEDVMEALQSRLRTSSVAIVTQLEQFRLQRQSVSGFVDKPFLYDGLRPQDLQRMNPPRSVPGLTVPPPANEVKK